MNKFQQKWRHVQFLHFSSSLEIEFNMTPSTFMFSLSSKEWKDSKKSYEWHAVTTEWFWIRIEGEKSLWDFLWYSFINISKKTNILKVHGTILWMAFWKIAFSRELIRLDTFRICTLTICFLISIRYDIQVIRPKILHAIRKLIRYINKDVSCDTSYLCPSILSELSLNVIQFHLDLIILTSTKLIPLAN